MDQEKKKKVDYEALASSFMHIPKMDLVTARSLINLGYRESFQLVGLSPEVLFEEIKKKDPKTPKDLLCKLRMAIYFVETPEPDPKKMDPLKWV